MNVGYKGIFMGAITGLGRQVLLVYESKDTENCLKSHNIVIFSSLACRLLLLYYPLGRIAQRKVTICQIVCCKAGN